MWKIEHICDYGIFSAPKVYIINDIKNGLDFKAKGIRKNDIEKKPESDIIKMYDDINNG